MTLSNKILVGFLAFIFVYLTAAFAEIRLRGFPHVIDDKNSIAETIDIQNVSYLILTGLEKNIDVIGSDRARLEVRSLSGDQLKKLKYEISGDTLTLSGVQTDPEQSIKISVFIPTASLKGLTVNNSVAFVEGLQQGFFRISQDSGRIWMSKSKISKMQIDISKHSYLDISNTSLDTVSATIDRSELLLSSPVGVLLGSMKDNSALRLSDVREIQFKKDSTSRLSSYQ